ncbi:MAG: hypothetical protein ACHREM_22395 [Polyangiales bacterium]
MNIRMLIQRAIEEARAEFESIVARRLAELMGDAPSSSARKAPSSKAKAAPPAKRGPRPGRRAPRVTLAPAGLDEVVLRAIASGDGLGKSAILAAAGLTAKDDARVSASLVRLRSAGRIVMTGSRRGASYRTGKRRGGSADATGDSTTVSAPMSAPLVRRPRKARATRKKAAASVEATTTLDPSWRPTVIRRKKEETSSEG